MPNCAGGGGKASDPFSLFEGASDVDGFRPVLELDELELDESPPQNELSVIGLLPRQDIELLLLG